jgi:hypothetical protein
MSQKIPVPAHVAALRLLDRVDYQDAFSLETPVVRTPEEWTRLVLDRAPNVLRSFVRYAHLALGLRLAPRGSPDHLWGWAVLQSGPDAFVLGAGGGLGTPRIVVLTPPGGVVFATILRFSGLRARVVWAGVAPIHRAVARYLLDRTSKIDRDPRDPRTSHHPTAPAFTTTAESGTHHDSDSEERQHERRLI